MGVGDTFKIGAASYTVVSKPGTMDALRLWGLIARCTKQTSLDTVVSIGDAFIAGLTSVDVAKLREEGSGQAVINTALAAAVRGLERRAGDFMDLIGHEEFPALVVALLQHVERNGVPLARSTVDVIDWQSPTEPMDAAREAAKALGFFVRPSTSPDVVSPAG